MAMLMVDLIVTILMFLVGFGKIKHDDYKSKARGDLELKEWENVDLCVESELIIYSCVHPTFEDGTPINPHIQFNCERLWAVNQQLKKRGLRMNPDRRRDMMIHGGVFDKNGLCPKNPYYEGKK